MLNQLKVSTQNFSAGSSSCFTAQAIKINDFIYQASGVGNTFLVTTPDGNIVIDTGLAPQASQHKEILQAVDSGPIKFIIVSHAHAYRSFFTIFGQTGGIGLNITRGSAFGRAS